MHNRLTSRRRPEASASGPTRGKTVPAQGETQHKVPRMPHERDESSDSQAPQEPSAQRIGEQAFEDIERGVVDSGKGPVLDQTYDKVREDTRDPQKKYAP